MNKFTGLLMAILMCAAGPAAAFTQGQSYPDVPEQRLTPVGSQYEVKKWDGTVERDVMTLQDAVNDPENHIAKGPDRGRLSVIEKDMRIAALERKVVMLKRALKEKEARLDKISGVYVSMQAE